MLKISVKLILKFIFIKLVWSPSWNEWLVQTKFSHLCWL